MQPLKLNDDQMEAVLAASMPIPFNRRTTFLAEVASALNQLPENRRRCFASRHYGDPTSL
jgi:DNA-directed RNA polymerase specialized sigma24 family protein